MPLALVECGRNKALYVYANNSYLRRVHELGYASIDVLERAFNDHRSDQYLMIKKLATDAISLGSPKGFIQSSFRLRWDDRDDGCADSSVGPWYTARVSRIPASAERAYLLTIQSHPANEARHLDVIARDHPEILE